jgi:hypothetical protein
VLPKDLAREPVQTGGVEGLRLSVCGGDKNSVPRYNRSRGARPRHRRGPEHPVLGAELYRQTLFAGGTVEAWTPPLHPVLGQKTGGKRAETNRTKDEGINFHEEGKQCGCNQSESAAEPSRYNAKNRGPPQGACVCKVRDFNDSVKVPPALASASEIAAVGIYSTAVVLFRIWPG